MHHGCIGHMHCVYSHAVTIVDSDWLESLPKDDNGQNNITPLFFGGGGGGGGGGGASPPLSTPFILWLIISWDEWDYTTVSFYKTPPKMDFFLIVTSNHLDASTMFAKVLQKYS